MHGLNELHIARAFGVGAKGAADQVRACAEDNGISARATISRRKTKSLSHCRISVVCEDSPVVKTRVTSITLKVVGSNPAMTRVR